MSDPGAPRRTVPLSDLFASPALGRLVVFLALTPGEGAHLRELRRRTRLSLSSLQRELGRLERMGALVRAAEGPRVLFRADEAHPAWTAWRMLLRASADPREVLDVALAGAPGVEAAFLFGSTATGDARPDSDVDLFLVGSDASRRSVRPSLAEAEVLLGRELDVVGYDRETLYSRARTGGFVGQVMENRRKWQWIVGSPEALDDPEGGGERG